jgi:cytochrome c oxidase subunit II
MPAVQRADVRRRLFVTLVVLCLLGAAVLVAAGGAFAGNAGFTPENAHSPNAHRTNEAYYLILVFTSIIFVLVETLLVVFVWKYRSRGRARTVEGSQVHGHNRLEILWTAIPVLIIVIIFGFVFYKLPGIATVPKASAAEPNLRIKIDAHQFYWQFTYPNGAVSIDEVHLPLDRVVEFDVNSEDVNHSWWIPQLGGKIDAIPGRTNHIWYKPETIGTFFGQCAEFCGIFHEKMLARAIVETTDDYQHFISTTAAQQLGKAQWVGVCAKCHGMQGQGDYGPAIASNPILIQPAGLTQILRNGFDGPRPGVMPAVGNNWTEAQIRALEQYVKANIYKGSTSGG